MTIKKAIRWLFAPERRAAAGGVVKALLLVVLSFSPPILRGEDGVNRDDPNFVTVSLLLTTPGKEIFSCAGHTCFRMECPQFKLDTCYSYESEGAYSRLLAFFAGKLKMGMFAFPTKDYLAEYAKDGRGVRQYRLDLSPAAKVRLWKLLDDKVALGADQPYDYERRGCAQSTFRLLQEALLPERLAIARWPEKYRGKRRQIIASAIDNSPWARIAIHTIVGTGGDRDVTTFEKVVIPQDLVDILKLATVGGRAVIAAGEGKVLLAEDHQDVAAWLTPVKVAVVFLLLALANWFLRSKAVDCVFLAIQTVIGLFLAYLVCFSGLPATDWNWLCVPLNPLPLALWRWRRLWAWPFAAALVAWSVGMFFSSEMRTDPAYVIFALALAFDYGRTRTDGLRKKRGG